MEFSVTFCGMKTYIKLIKRVLMLYDIDESLRQYFYSQETFQVR